MKTNSIFTPPYNVSGLVLPTQDEAPLANPDHLINIFKPTNYYTSTRWNWQQDTLDKAKADQEAAILKQTMNEKCAL